jgi:hypothetical protein
MLNAVACPSSTQCYALGSTSGRHGPAGPGFIIGSSDGGDRWKLLMTTPKILVSGISCPASGTCVVGGASSNPTSAFTNISEAFVTKNSGLSWSAQTLPPLYGVGGVACASVNVCLVIGPGGIARTTNGGMSWVPESAPRGFYANDTIDSVACPTSSFCIIGGEGSAPAPTANNPLPLPPSVDSVSHDSGATWTKAAFVAGPFRTGPESSSPPALSSISCSDSRHCVGLITTVASFPSTFGTEAPIVTEDAGRSWRRESTRVGWAVSCVKNSCVSVGGHFRDPTTGGYAFTSTDGGVNWSQSNTQTNQILTSVSCPSPTHCVAVGGILPTAKSAVIMIEVSGS